MNTFTVFAMNTHGEVVGGFGHRVGPDELVQLMDKLLDSNSVDDDNDETTTITYVEVHDGCCRCSPSGITVAK